MKYNKFFDSLKKPKQNTEYKDIFCCEFPLKVDANYMVCSRCGIIKPLLINETNNTILYEPRIIKQTYSRKIHFKKILLQIQGREIFNNKSMSIIKEYLQKNNITDYSTENVKNVLFNLKLNQYYLHIQLVRRFLGCQMVIMSDELMNRLMRLFISIEEQITPSGNFPSYHYILRRLLHYLNNYEFDHLLKRLKSETRLDKLWSKIKLE